MRWNPRIGLFYILTEKVDNGYQFIGAFTRNRERTRHQHNLNCITCLPIDRKNKDQSLISNGYGQILIELSYALSRREENPGGPEAPFSTLGLGAYLKYWTRILTKLLLERINNGTYSNDQSISLTDLTLLANEELAMSLDDLIYTL